jgi:hypothetical protein
VTELAVRDPAVIDDVLWQWTWENTFGENGGSTSADCRVDRIGRLRVPIVERDEQVAVLALFRFDATRADASFFAR